MNRWTISAICLLAAFSMAACGGGEAANNTAATNTPAPAKNDAPANEPDEGPAVDPILWRKVTIPTPAGWVKPSHGHAELTKSDYKILKKPGGEFVRLAFFTDTEPPHASSGSEPEWLEWRNNVSACFVYNASKTKDDPVETLKQHGGSFIDGFDAGKVGSVGGFAVYKHPAADYKWLACTSNANGTYILCALVRSDDAENLMKPYPGTIKPE